MDLVFRQISSVIGNELRNKRSFPGRRRWGWGEGRSRLLLAHICRISKEERWTWPWSGTSDDWAISNGAMLQVVRVGFKQGSSLGGVSSLSGEVCKHRLVVRIPVWDEDPPALKLYAKEMRKKSDRRAKQGPRQERRYYSSSGWTSSSGWKHALICGEFVSANERQWRCPVCLLKWIPSGKKYRTQQDLFLFPPPSFVPTLIYLFRKMLFIPRSWTILSARWEHMTTEKSHGWGFWVKMMFIVRNNSTTEIEWMKCTGTAYLMNMNLAPSAHPLAYELEYY